MLFLESHTFLINDRVLVFLVQANRNSIKAKPAEETRLLDVSHTSESKIVGGTNYLTFAATSCFIPDTIIIAT